MIINGTELRMTRGDTESIDVYCINESSALIPLVDGDAVYFTVKASVDDEDVIIQKIVSSFTEGKASITIEPEDTNELSYGNYVYDVQITKADGTVKTIIAPSEFVIGPEVTYE